MQIYLFIVCNHATEPNMAFFVQKSRKGGGREGKKKLTTAAVMQSRRGCC